ncbi:SM-like, degradation of cytoplasmic mRNAs and positively regulates transcription initiation [Purpureocillium lilacinum]|uniref:SM-like, degradation of cytoplasmic mRNAs and positively regulates transcription initiation n=1 Tax=Purpureocillium lilacinum TaxID=33203 RepID=UPI002081484E|nr:SM-like, degradation of cytoplasmic mRNAs and positively regulates transcription initiation [Purpureocillium lilacinum]
MENLSISDAPPAAPPPQGPSQPGGPSQPPPQLPPQMFTTAAQLLDLTDKKLMVVLRDGRKLIANIVLQSTTERIFATNPDSAISDAAPRGLYADISHGIFLVRGENVLLLGEIDLDRDDDPPPGYEPAELELVKRLADEKKAAEKARDKSRLKKLAKMGFEGESQGEIVLG